MPSVILSDNGVSSGSAGLKTTASNDGILVLQTTTSGGTATNVMYSDTAQNVGFGVTPSAWNTAGLGRALQLVNSESRSSSLASWYGAVGLMNDAYYGTDNNFKYYSGAATALYQQAAGVHSWHYAASGTAGNTVTMTQAMTLDASGRLGIGTTSPSSQLHIENSSANATQLIKYTGTGGASQALFTLQNSAGNSLSIGTVSSTWSSGSGLTPGDSYVGASGNLLIGAGGTLPVAKFDSSGNLLVGTTSVGTNQKSIFKTTTVSAWPLSLEGDNRGLLVIQSASSGIAAYFQTSTSTVAGSINISGSTTTYSTSSDYRLKNITGSLTGYKERLSALQPKQGSWKADNSEFRGFLAHEFAESYPSSVNGEKDAVDEQGNPQYQGMQAGSTEVIADLVAYIKELETRLSALEQA